MTTLDRTPGGVLLVGQGGRSYHPVAAGAAACAPSLPIPDPVPIDQATGVRWCERQACRPHWQRERRAIAVAVAGDVEHVCPACHVERAIGGPCPSCGSGYAAVPAAVA